MTSLLTELIGKQVEITSIGGETRFVDRGVLEAFDEQWVRIRKGNELLFFPIYRIRLLKVV